MRAVIIESALSGSELIRVDSNGIEMVKGMEMESGSESASASDR